MNTTHLQAAQQAARAAREALRAALTEASAVEALHLYPMIASAATLESAIESLRLAVDADQDGHTHTSESLAKHFAKFSNKPADEFQAWMDESLVGNSIFTRIGDATNGTTYLKTGPNCWELVQ